MPAHTVDDPGSGEVLVAGVLDGEIPTVDERATSDGCERTAPQLGARSPVAAERAARERPGRSVCLPCWRAQRVARRPRSPPGIRTSALRGGTPRHPYPGSSRGLLPSRQRSSTWTTSPAPRTHTPQRTNAPSSPAGSAGGQGLNHTQAAYVTEYRARMAALVRPLVEARGYRYRCPADEQFPGDPVVGCGATAIGCPGDEGFFACPACGTCSTLEGMDRRA